MANPIDPVTHDYVFNQTMIRIKEPQRSLAFYHDVLGMTLVRQVDFPEMKFSLYFLGKLKEGETVPEDDIERANMAWSREAMLELTWNYGTETDPDYKYCNGNVPTPAEGRGFGHIGFSVSDVYATCARFEAMGVPFIKKPDGGKMKGIAFIQDPDGYWIEILPKKFTQVTTSS